MASVLRSTKQPRTKYLVALATSVPAFTMASEETAPVASSTTLTAVIGDLFLDMGKIVVTTSGDVYRKIKPVTNVYGGGPLATEAWIKDADLDGTFGANTKLARL